MAEPELFDLPELKNVPKDLLPVPEKERNGRTIDQMWVWVGANVAVTTWAVGALPISLGLSLKEAFAIILFGNFLGAVLFAFAVIMGQKTGVGQMVLCRVPFGRRGGNLAALMQFILTTGWLGVNSFFAVSAISKLLSLYGIVPTLTINVIISIVVFLSEVIIGIYGYYVIKDADRIMAPIMGILALAMLIIAISKGVDWGYAGKSGGLGHGAALAIAMGAMGIGWPISWTTWAADYSRYVPSSASTKKTFWWGFAGMFIPASLLMAMGAIIAASLGTGAEPAEMVCKVVPWFSIPALILVFLGVVSTNIINVHSGALAALTMGAKLSRPKIGAIIGVIGFAVCFAALFISNIATVLDQWMLTLIVWMSPWLAVVLTDYYLLHRQKVDLLELYKPHTQSKYGDINWIGIGSWMVGVILGNLFASTPLFTGPFAKLLGGGDWSWLVGFIVAGVLHYVLSPKSFVESVNKNQNI